MEGLDVPYYSFEYPAYSKYFVSMNIKDKYANEATKKRALNLK
jgi:hypothetical protein